MSTATSTSQNTGQHTASRTTTQPTNTPTTQLERTAAQRLRTTMAAVKLSFTWLGVRKTLAPEQRTTAARAFHADRELLSASKFILDTKNPAYRAVAAVRSEASSYWRTVTLPFPEAGIRLLPQNSLGMFATTMQTYRERLQESARELSSQYDTMKSEAERRLGTLFNASDYPTTLDGLFDLEWSVVPIEPPQYLVALNPEVFQQEQARVRERFESAVATCSPRVESHWLVCVRLDCDAEPSANLHRLFPPVPSPTSMARAREPDLRDENRWCWTRPTGR
jgi:hypothetical protein